MECEDFLKGYSEYLDGLLSSSEAAEFEAHRGTCERCARYDRVVQRGLQVFRSLPEVDSCPDFLPRLQHRIYHIEDDIPLRGIRHGGSAALVAVAAVGLLAFAWLPFATTVPVEVELAAVEARAPEPPSARPPEVTPSSLFTASPFTEPSALFLGRGPFLSGTGYRWSDGLAKSGVELLWPTGVSLTGGASFLVATQRRALPAR